MKLTEVVSRGASDLPPELREVDQSFRLAGLFLVAKASFWLVLGTLFTFLASVKIHAPGMMSGIPWLTYGRLAPAGWDMIVYGFAGQAGFAVALWLLAHACRQRLQGISLVFAGGAAWNIGVLIGVIGILAGFSSGRELLEMPLASLVFLWLGGTLIGVAGWMTYVNRREGNIYPSAWFILLALLSFVWFATVAWMMYSGAGVRGVMQVLVQRWYAAGITKLWLGGIGLAVVYHVLPLLLNRPLASRRLALVSFWCLALFAPWTAPAGGDPFPRWIISMGTAAHFLALIGVVATAMNWWRTAEGSGRVLWQTDPGRLILVAGFSYLVSVAFQFAVSFSPSATVTRFTWIHPGLDWLMVLGAVGCAVIAVIPEMVRRTTGIALAPGLVRLHTWLTWVGVLLIAVPFLLGGIYQGAALNSASKTFLEVLRGSLHFVRLSSLGLIVFLGGQLLLMMGLMGVFQRLATGWLGAAKTWCASSVDDRRPEAAT